MPGSRLPALAGVPLPQDQEGDPFFEWLSWRLSICCCSKVPAQLVSRIVRAWPPIMEAIQAANFMGLDCQLPTKAAPCEAVRRCDPIELTLDRLAIRIRSEIVGLLANGSARVDLEEQEMWSW
jgi:hypothetical protein